MISANEKQMMLWIQRLAALVVVLAPKPVSSLTGHPVEGTILRQNRDGNYIAIEAAAENISNEIDQWIANGGRKV